MYYTKPEGVQDSVSAGSGKMLDNKMFKSPFNCAIFPLTQTQVVVVLVSSSSSCSSLFIYNLKQRFFYHNNRKHENF